MHANSEGGILLLVVHWNRPEECLATINHLRAQRSELRIVVIDNASEPAALVRLEAGLPDKVDLRRLPQNLGWGGAINVVLREWVESGEEHYCLISAHDAVPAGGCVDLLASAMLRDPKIGIACPQYGDNSVGVLSRWHGVAQRFFPPREEGTLQEVDLPHGTLMLVRRECLRHIGCFDERYFAYGDEHDLGVRATRNGWKVVLVWGAIVTNPGTWTPSPLRSYFFARNSLLLVATHFGTISALARAGVLLISALRHLASNRDSKLAFSWRAHFQGIRDYFLGRFGFPGK